MIFKSFLGKQRLLVSKPFVNVKCNNFLFTGNKFFNTTPVQPNKAFSRAGDSLAKSYDSFQADPKFRQPEFDQVVDLPRRFREVSNEAVFQLAIQGHHGATRERLVREIMRVDNCTWIEARTKVEVMNKENDKYAWIALLPYRVGVVSGMVGGGLSLPMVFHKDTVIWFSRDIVGMPPSEIPVEEMTTFWSVGSFSWGYMEPLLGTLSFVLLAAQFMRANMQHMGLHPYTDRINIMRGRRLCKLFPQYDKNIVMEFSITDKWHK